MINKRRDGVYDFDPAEHPVRAWAVGTSTAVMVGIGVVLVAIIVGLVGIFGFGWLSNSTANFRGDVAVHNKVNANGDYRIAAYDSFFDQCATVQTDKSLIKNTLLDVKVATAAKDTNRLEQLQANLSAQRNKLAGDVNQYNVDAAKGYTKGQFKSSDLPARLHTEGKTRCTA